MSQLSSNVCRIYGNDEHFLREEFANSITHGGGLLLAVAGSVWMIFSVADSVNFSIQLGCWVYASTMIGAYAASTLSHVVTVPKQRHFFRSLDQGVIFLFIAGSLTPIALILLNSEAWMWLLPLVWIVAITGFCSKVFWKHRVESISVTYYLVLGWLPITAAQPLLQSISEAGLFWVAAGGLCYTSGIVFLVYDEKVPYFHAIWHLFVIAGSTCHYIAIVKYVLPS